MFFWKVIINLSFAQSVDCEAYRLGFLLRAFFSFRLSSIYEKTTRNKVIAQIRAPNIQLINNA